MYDNREGLWIFEKYWRAGGVLNIHREKKECFLGINKHFIYSKHCDGFIVRGL